MTAESHIAKEKQGSSNVDIKPKKSSSLWTALFIYLLHKQSETFQSSSYIITGLIKKILNLVITDHQRKVGLF